MFRHFTSFCLATFLAISSAHAISYPTFSLGTTFTGTLKVDPDAPFDSSLDFYNAPGGLGSMSITIDDNTLSTTLTRLNVPTGFGSYSWFSGSGDLEPGGVSIALFLNGSTTSSGSIYPEPLSAYASNKLVFTTLDTELINGAGVFKNYSSELWLLAQVGSSNEFSLSGIITEVPTSAIAAVPEPSSWAMLLVGFAGIGLAAYRRRYSFTAAR